MILYVEDVLLESFAVACVTFQGEVSHELHLDGDDSCPLTFLTASAVGVE